MRTILKVTNVYYSQETRLGIQVEIYEASPLNDSEEVDPHVVPYHRLAGAVQKVPVSRKVSSRCMLFLQSARQRITWAILGQSS